MSGVGGLYPGSVQMPSSYAAAAPFAAPAPLNFSNLSYSNPPLRTASHAAPAPLYTHESVQALRVEPNLEKIEDKVAKKAASHAPRADRTGPWAVYAGTTVIGSSMLVLAMIAAKHALSAKAHAGSHVTAPHLAGR